MALSAGVPESAGDTVSVSVAMLVTFVHSIAPLICTAMKVPFLKRVPWPLCTTTAVVLDPALTAVDPSSACSVPRACVRMMRSGMLPAVAPYSSCTALGVVLR